MKAPHKQVESIEYQMDLHSIQRTSHTANADLFCNFFVFCTLQFAMSFATKFVVYKMFFLKKFQQQFIKHSKASL